MSSGGSGNQGIVAILVPYNVGKAFRIPDPTICRSIAVNPEDGSAWFTTSEGTILRYRADTDTVVPVKGDGATVTALSLAGVHVAEVELRVGDAEPAGAQGVIGIDEEQQRPATGQLRRGEQRGDIGEGADLQADVARHGGLHDHPLQRRLSRGIVGDHDAVGLDVRHPGFEHLAVHQAAVDAGQNDPHARLRSGGPARRWPERCCPGTAP